jgi:hypothetical protein
MEYVFEIRATPDPKTGVARYRWSLVSSAGAQTLLRSDQAFDSEDACVQDIEDRRHQLTRATVRLVVEA